jgi:hypothetical protein
MSFTAMQPARVPSTETPMLGSYQLESTEAEERLPAQTGNKDELAEENLHEQQLPQSSLCATSYDPQPVPELCSHEPVNCGHSSKNPVNYQQQQSEEEDFNQANIVNTVVVNNSNIVTEPSPFVETKQSDLVDTVNLKYPQSAGHQSCIKSDLQPTLVSDKVSAQADLVDGDSSVNQSSRISISESSSNGNTVVSDFELKKDTAVTNGVNRFSPIETCEVTDVKSPLSCGDIPASSVTTPKAAYGHDAEHHAGGPSVTADMSLAMPVQKSWASLFKPESVLPPSGNKPLACVKPFQNKVPVTPGASCGLLEEGTAPDSAVSPGVVNSLSLLPSSSAVDDPYLYQLGGEFSLLSVCGFEL